MVIMTITFWRSKKFDQHVCDISWQYEISSHFGSIGNMWSAIILMKLKCANAALTKQCCPLFCYHAFPSFSAILVDDSLIFQICCAHFLQFLLGNS
jgi:hypothetical protein